MGPNRGSRSEDRVNCPDPTGLYEAQQIRLHSRKDRDQKKGSRKPSGFLVLALGVLKWGIQAGFWLMNLVFNMWNLGFL